LGFCRPLKNITIPPIDTKINKYKALIPTKKNSASSVPDIPDSTLCIIIATIAMGKSIKEIIRNAFNIFICFSANPGGISFLKIPQ